MNVLKPYTNFQKEKSTKLNIVLVDDKAYFRKGMKDLLVSRFSDRIQAIEEVSNGKEFLSLLDVFPANLAFIDIEIPVINGIEATIQAKQKNPDLKIFALTIHDDLSYIKSMNNAGVDGFLSKNEEFPKRLEVILKYYSLYETNFSEDSNETKMDMLLAGLIIDCPIKMTEACPLNEIWYKPYNERIKYLRRLSKVEKQEIITQHKKCMSINKLNSKSINWRIKYEK